MSQSDQYQKFDLVYTKDTRENFKILTDANKLVNNHDMCKDEKVPHLHFKKIKSGK